MDLLQAVKGWKWKRTSPRAPQLSIVQILLYSSYRTTYNATWTRPPFWAINYKNEIENRNVKRSQACVVVRRCQEQTIAYRFCNSIERAKMANSLPVAELNLEHSGDESDDDDDDVVEQSPCGRWEKRRQEVGLTLFLMRDYCEKKVTCKEPKKPLSNYRIPDQWKLCYC